ncbi:MAG: hypothetical protein KDA44_04425 [Planctomycetales bacterium]|nr:hypothetical protein [Planctomycetales bacterium]
MPPVDRTIAVVGHICLDVIPAFASGVTSSNSRLEPGQLYLMGPVDCTTGGTVANTGLALHKLGASVRLVGKVGDDLFGRAVLEVLSSASPELTTGMLVDADEPTSYSIVISPPGVDRTFLHCPGANDSFCPSEVVDSALAGVGLLHFGYPPLMRRVYDDGGRELAALFQRARARGIMTSLDMSMPDPNSPAGQVDWRDWLARVLPHVDLYLPSFEETRFMLTPAGPDSPATSDGSRPTPELLRTLADQLIGFGAGVVVLKLGAWGLYLKSAEREQAEKRPLQLGESWSQRELWAPCFEVNASGTTGAGDCTIAGLLAAAASGAAPAQALVQAVAVGACSVEAADATSGIRSLDETRARIAAGWRRRDDPPPADDWRYDQAHGLWIGPGDESLSQTD